MSEEGLGVIVRSALVAAGCDSSLIKELDDHGTIQIELNGCPSMYIARYDGQVMLWSDLCDYHDSIVMHQAQPLLRMVMEGFAYGRHGQLILRESEGRLQLLSDLASPCLDQPDAVASALDTFYKCLLRTVEIIRQ